MAYEPQVPYAITQFEIDVLIPIELFGMSVGFTNSSLAMVTTVILLGTYTALALKDRQFLPNRLQSSIEIVYEQISGIVLKTAGPEAKSAIPLFFTLFVFVLFGSLFGLAPYKFTFTSHFIVTLSLAFFVFAYVNVIGFRKHGLALFGLFLPSGTPGYLVPLIVLVEVISYLFRPITLGFRIFANILAGHIMIKLFIDLSLMMSDALGFVGMALSIFNMAFVCVLLVFEMAIFAIQSYIFVLLSSLYLKDTLSLH
ncbi:MAG: F0F1 ATP synthase subunit A [Pseudomonadota bacterium]